MIKPKTRLVESVYETREKKQFVPPVIYSTQYKQVWVPAEYTTVCRKEWVPRTFKTVCREVKGECIYEDVQAQKYIPPKVRCVKTDRCIPDGNGGFTKVEDVDFVIEEQGRFETVSEKRMVRQTPDTMMFETVEDKPGYWKEHIETVMVKPGHYRTVAEQVKVCEGWCETVEELVEVQPARVETVQEQVLVKPARYEECETEVERNPF